MLGNDSTWTITNEEFSQHRVQFEHLNPVNGFISGIQAKEYFTKSKLSNQILGKIWNLADYDKDGRMTVHEFSIAMHLIKKRLDGISLPNNLPKEMLVPPQDFQYPDASSNDSRQSRVAPSYSDVIARDASDRNSFREKAALPPDLPPHMPPLPKRSSPQEDWTIMQGVRPRYRLQFNQQDRHKKGYLSGEEAKLVLLQSGLSNNILAQIWNLSDVDCDGKLTCEEFCVAMYLVEQARAGRSLPTKLPDSLIPPSMLTSSVTKSQSVTATSEPPEWTSINDSRPGTLQATPRSPHVSQTLSAAAPPWPDKAQENAKINVLSQRNHKMEVEKQRLMDLEQTKLQQAIEERNKEKELLKQLKDRQEYLIEALAAEEEKCQQFQAKLKESKMSVESQKSQIQSMRNERDIIVDTTSCLTEELEAARAEHSRCQRDKNSLIQKLKKDLQNNPFHDNIKEIEKQKQIRLSTINHLQKEICDLQMSIDRKTENVATNASKLQNLEQTVNSQHILEIMQLKFDIQSKRCKALEVLEKNRNQGEEKNDFIKIIEPTLDRYEAIFKFTGRQADELQFNIGDIILVRNPMPDTTPSGWMCGRLVDSDFFGLFPEVYVKRIEHIELIEIEPMALSPDTECSSDKEHNIFDQTLPEGSTIKKAPNTFWVEAIYPWMTDAGDVAQTHLSFRVGQKIRVIEEASEDWWRGEMCTSTDDGEMYSVGWFPRIYVKPVVYSTDETSEYNTTMKYSNLSFAASNDISGAPVSPNTSTHSSSSGEYCMALYPYESSVPGDLTMRPGDIIQVVDTSADWWKGHLRGTRETGLFPSRYVKKLTKQDLESAGNVSTMSSDYYTSLTLENGDSLTMAYDDIDHSTFNSDHLVHNDDSGVSCTSRDLNYDTLAADEPSNGENAFPRPPVIHTATVVTPVTAVGGTEVHCTIGQIVRITDDSHPDRYQIEISVNGQTETCWVPKDCLKILRDSPFPVEFSDPMTASGYDRCVSPEVTAHADEETARVGEKFIAMYPYSAQNPDELSFTKNAVIQLLSKDEPEWWKGCNIASGMIGLFPVNYVRSPNLKCASDSDIIAQCIPAMSEELGNAYSTVTGRPISWYIDGKVNFKAILTEDEKRRQFYILELIETEKAYYDDLQEVHRVFYEPIKRTGILTNEELKHIFLNWVDLISISYSFYMALKIRQENAGQRQPIQCIGDIILSNFPHFIVYVRFCSMQNHAIVFLEKRKQSNPKFREFCEQCEENLRCKKMPMTSYFLKPMQRITKYKLLVENILKYTEEGHPDRGDMEEAVAASRSLCEAVNEGIREKENSERLEWIQEHVSCEGLNDTLFFNSTTNSLGHRKLIYSGTVFKAKSGKELVGFLFNDFLLLSTPSYNTNGCPFVFPLETSSTSKMQFKMYKKPILLNRVLIMTGIPSNQNSLSVTATTGSFGSVSNNEIFTIREAGNDHVLKALSLNDRDKWIERLVAASLQYIEIENSVREISMSIRRSAGLGRLIVTVLEGVNLKGSSAGDNKVNAYCEASLGNQLRRTKVISSTYNPKWHCHMQFLIKCVELDVLCLAVYDKEYFAPNEFLGRIEVAVKDIKASKLKNKGPVELRLKLMGVTYGELLVRFDLALFRND